MDDASKSKQELIAEVQRLRDRERALEEGLAESEGRRRCEQARAAEALEFMAQANAELLARAEDAGRLKDEFLATLSHELRTPMTSILGWSRLLSAGAVPPERLAKALQTIDRHARAQAQLIDDLLDFSRIVTGKLRLHVEPVDLAHVVEAAVEAALPTADARGVRLHAALDAGAGAIMGDASRLQQVAWNLLTNAVKFSARGGLVEVTLRREDSHVVLAVADGGCGIAADFLPHVFERFRQADGGIHRAHGGLGLGLAIVRSVVEQHGGRVEARSDGEGAGATFTAHFPVAPARPHSPPLGTPRAQPGAPFDCPPGLVGLRILVVDDEADTRELLAGILAHCRVEVRTAGSADEAMALLRDAVPDVLVSDLGMPGDDGLSLIRRVRALAPEDGGRVPAVALTAYASAQDRTHSLLAGFQMHVTKPVEPQELLVVIATLAERVSMV